MILFFTMKEYKKELNYKLIIVKQGINKGVEGIGEVDKGEEAEYNLARV